MPDRKFVHLHLHTHYSLLDGFNRIPPLMEQTKKLGMNAVAITDHGNLYGAIEFYEACRKNGLNPIIGYEAYLAPTHRGERTKSSGGSGEASTHLTLLAKNRTGFYNLVKLSSIAFLEGFYYKPRIDREVLEAHREGLICLSGCLAGQFNRFILEDKPQEAERLAKYFHKLFGDDFYIEIQANGLRLQNLCTPVAAEISAKLGVPLVATADAHYLCSDDAIAHDILFCINTKKLHDPRKKTYPEEDMPNPYFVRSPDDMYRLFPDYADAVARSQTIADGCDIQLDFSKRNFPVFQTPRELTADEYLRELCLQGIKERYGDSPSKAVFDRLEIELGVVSHMGYSAYFLIVWDFVRYAREKGIRSTARGSGVGVIVSYVLYISHVCPLEYDLLFERFLDKSRKEPPDIDIDFDQDRREEVIQYVKDKYGHASVAQIGTFGTLAAKAALKDVGRVLNIPLERVNYMCKLVPMKGAIALDLKDALGVPEFRREYDTDPIVRHWVDVALKLEGMNRNVGTHAAGVVIASGPITDYVPVQRVMRKDVGEDGEKSAGEVVITTQWEMGVVEKVGMLKMDFLGLRNLSMLDETVRLIKRTRGLDIDPMTLPLDDPDTYKLLQRGDAKGVFQLESDGMRRLLQQMKPDNIRDIIAVLALYRPGPLEAKMVDAYIDRKHGREVPVYDHPILEEVLGETYNVIVYQEQVMRVLNRLGGIELSKSYAVIKAISKKVVDKIEAARADFLAGCASQGVSKEIAEHIFGQIVYFAGYGFNKCVVGETEVFDAETGDRVTVGELFLSDRRPLVHALGEDGNLRPRRVSDVVWNGRKRVYRLRTELGYEITATANHPFRTLDGWTNLGDLAVGSRIATPRHLVTENAESWPEHEIITLAGLLSEGNTCHPSTLYFYGNDRALVDDFASAVGQFPDTVARIDTRRGHRHEVAANIGNIPRARVPVDEDGLRRSGAYRWANELGVLGRTATEKRIPASVLRLCDQDLELFLGRLWAGDGFIANETLKVPFYATSSRGLAEDVQHLLLRVGIVSRIHNKQFKYRDTLKPGFAVHVLGDGAAERFLARIAPYCLGRESAVQQLRDYIASTQRGKSSKDTLPLEIRAWVDEERRQRGLTWAALEEQSGVSTQEFYGTPSAGKTGFRRSTILKLAEFFASSRLRDAAESDVFWDRVVSIEYVAVRDTYDLTVEEDHNFVANGLIVHNSHTAAYAQIGYQTAYLKTHFTAEFMAALLSSEIDEGAKRDLMVEHIADARKLGVEVEPPNVNKGQSDFDVVNGKIVFGLTAIKGLGRGAAAEIVRVREAGGPFRNLFDFCERVDLRVVKEGQIEKLIKAGAMDCFGPNQRAAMFKILPQAVSGAEGKAADRKRGQKNIFDVFDGEDAPDGTDRFGFGGPVLTDTQEWPELEKLKYEKEVLDFYISSHPLAQFDEQLRRYRSHDAIQTFKMDSGAEVRLAGMVIEIVPKLVSKGRNAGNRWAIVRVEDFTGSVKCIFWSDQYARFKDELKADAILLFDGKVEWREGSTEPDVIVEKVTTMEQARKDFTKGLILRMDYESDSDGREKFEAIGRTLKKSPGACPVYLTVRDPVGRAAQFKLSHEHFVDPVAVRVEELEMLLGPGKVLFSGR